MRYFSPRSLLRNAQTVKAQRANEIEWDPLVFTRHGDGPLEPQGDRGLFYDKPDALDDSCFVALGELSKRLKNEQRQLLVVSTPLHRSEEHTSELQSLMRISYAVFCLQKK